VIILALDVASTIGWAVHDTNRAPSAMQSGSIKLVGDGAFEKVIDMRRKLPRLIRQQCPDFAAVEAPLEFAPQFKKARKTIFGEDEEVSTTINSKTIAMLNRLSGAAIMAVIGQNVPCAEVRPQTWQTVIPDQFRGKPKQRAKAYCDMLRIVSPNMDSRDACVIAIWAAGHCQELKMLERARAA
jgi:Holliday junction resolvasome RuvABC endonuclease subunit